MYAYLIVKQIGKCVSSKECGIFNSFNYQKAEDKSFICKFSKNVKSKIYHIENRKTRGQTVQI